MLRIRNPQDFMAGLFFVLLGAGALWGMSDLRMGTAVRMGPAYLPSLVAWALIVVGVSIGLKGLIIAGPSLERWAWIPLALICGAMAFFGLVIAQAGLVLASMGVVIIACAAAPGRNWLHVPVIAIVLAAGAALLFHGLLGLPMKLWPW